MPTNLTDGPLEDVTITISARIGDRRITQTLTNIDYTDPYSGIKFTYDPHYRHAPETLATPELTGATITIHADGYWNAQSGTYLTHTEAPDAQN